MKRNEIDAIFEVDNEGKFLRLVIPPLYGFPRMNMVGKKKTEMSADEVVLIKKYAYMLYSNAEDLN